jgi:Tfp pilus assembly protein PilO
MESFNSIPVPKKNQNNSIFELVLLVVVVALIYFFLVKPKQEELTAIKSQKITLASQHEKVEDDKNKLISLVDALQSNQDTIAKLDVALPLNSKITLMYIMFRKIAEHATVTVNDLTVNAKGDGLVAGDKALLADPFKKQRSLGKATVSMSVSGTFSAFQNFLKQMEENGRIIDVTSIEVASNGTETLQFQLNLETYFYE